MIRRSIVSSLVLLIASAIACFGIVSIRTPQRESNRLGDLRLSGPFGFEPNVGQAEPSARFVARGEDYILTVSPAELKVIFLEGFGDVDHWFREEVFSLKLSGSAASAEAEGLDPLPGKSSFRAAGKQAGWRNDIPNFQRVSFRNVYPGIDLVCFGNQKHLQLLFVVAEGAQAGAIRIAWEGARRPRVAQDGTLSMRSPLGDVRILVPVTPDSFGGEPQSVPGRFLRSGRSRAIFQRP